MKRNEFYLPSSDGIHKLHCISYTPDAEPEKVLVIVHGMAEHIERYEGFMKSLAERGVASYAHDHVGHGKSVRDDSELGFIADKDGWKTLIDDVDVSLSNAVKEHPGAKAIVMGHSMGSFIARLYASKYADRLSGLIVMGTGGSNPAAGAGKTLADLTKKIKGTRRVSPLVNKLAFGAYNKRTEGKTPFDWLSTDENEVKKYIDDKYCGFDFSASAMSDLIRLNAYSNKRNAYTVKKGLPVLVVSGEEDPVGAYGKGPREVADKYASAGAAAECRIYPSARHEILNDKCREEVIKDIIGMISSI